MVMDVPDHNPRKVALHMPLPRVKPGVLLLHFG